MIPLVGERVEKYWNSADLDQYYISIWAGLMEVAGAEQLMDQEQYISWVVHDSPNQLLKRFPNSKIINLIDNDVDSIVERYKETTALFPVSIENSYIKPSYKNDYVVTLEELKRINAHPSYKDLWAWQTFKIPKYFKKLDTAYTAHLSEFMQNLSEQKQVQDTENILSVSWQDLDIAVIKNFIEADSIDPNYVELLVPKTF
jgi:hypothetical protein